MISQQIDYRTYLLEELNSRAKSEKITLRKFAKVLGISPSLLSDVLKGKKNISVDLAYQIAERLDLKEKETDFFILLVQSAKTKDMSVKQRLEEKIEKLGTGSPARQLNIDLFKLLRDWYYIPILLLTDLPQFRFSPENIAKTLGLSRIEVILAMKRLMRLRLLERDSAGRFSFVQNKAIFQSPGPNSHIQEYHRQIFSKCIQSFEGGDPNSRFIGCENMSFDPKQLPEVKKLCDEFLTRIAALSEKGRNKTAVYHLHVLFFNLLASGDSK